MTAERDILRRRFAFPAAKNVLLGIGDDSAIVRAPGNLALCADAMVCGRHFFPDADPFPLGGKALAVNLSDLAAMGARPLWALVVLAAEKRHGEKWMARLADGMRECADAFGFSVVGGDLTASETTTIAATLIGEAENGFIPRGGANEGDDVWLSGEAGEAALALRLRNGADLRVSEAARRRAFERMNAPVPRVELGRRLVGIASAALDVSDGLLQAAKDLALASGVLLRLRSETFPPAPALEELKAETRLMLTLEGGDDYELLFCAPPEKREAIHSAGNECDVRVSRIGEVVAGENNGGGAVEVFRKGEKMAEGELPKGYEHDFGE